MSFDKVIAEQTIRTEREFGVGVLKNETALMKENIELQKKLNETTKKLEEANEKIDSLETSSNSAITMVPAMFDVALPIMKEKIENNLLSQPMAELAERNKNFAEAYRLQQEMLANWMVSQKAFKELAIRFGKEKGLTKDEVIQQGLALKEDVLNSKNNPEHNTNSDNSNLIKPHIQSLKAKMKK